MRKKPRVQYALNPCPVAVCLEIEAHIAHIAAWVEKVSCGDTAQEFPLGAVGLQTEVAIMRKSILKANRVTAFIDCDVVRNSIEIYSLKIKVTTDEGHVLLPGITFTANGRYLSFFERNKETMPA